jgi:hypothetical protein
MLPVGGELHVRELRQPREGLYRNNGVGGTHRARDDQENNVDRGGARERRHGPPSHPTECWRARVWTTRRQDLTTLLYSLRELRKASPV